MKCKKRPKVLMAASIGGHWIQLLRIAASLEDKCDIVYVSTHEKCGCMAGRHRFYNIADFSRWNAYKLVPAFFALWAILKKESPDAVVSTGAAPGLLTLLTGKLMGKKTIWVDSIANVEKLSLCGKIASRVAGKTFTQWEKLATNNICFSGNVLE